MSQPLVGRSEDRSDGKDSLKVSSGVRLTGSLTSQIGELQKSVRELKELFESKINCYVTLEEFKTSDSEITEILKNHAEAIKVLQSSVVN